MIYIYVVHVSFCFLTPHFMRRSTSQHRLSEPEAFLAAWLHGSKYTSCDWACGAPWPHRWISISGLLGKHMQNCTSRTRADLLGTSQTGPEGYIGFQTWKEQYDSVWESQRSRTSTMMCPEGWDTAGFGRPSVFRPCMGFGVYGRKWQHTVPIQVFQQRTWTSSLWNVLRYTGVDTKVVRNSSRSLTSKRSQAIPLLLFLDFLFRLSQESDWIKTAKSIQEWGSKRVSLSVGPMKALR